jgi:hypothetical protein
MENKFRKINLVAKIKYIIYPRSLLKNKIGLMYQCTYTKVNTKIFLII